MFGLTLRTMNNIVNDYTDHANRNTSVIKHELAGKYHLPYPIIENVIYEYEYGYIDAQDVDLGEKLGIDNPEWEHKPEAFLMFRAVHQSWAYDHCLQYEGSKA